MLIVYSYGFIITGVGSGKNNYDFSSLTHLFPTHPLFLPARLSDVFRG